MYKIKHLLSAVLACIMLLALLFSFSGCGTTVTVSSVDNSQSEESSVPSEESSEEESSEEESVYIQPTSAYLAGEEPSVQLYTLSSNDVMQEAISLPRGTEVLDAHQLWEGSTLLREYEEILIQDQTYYVLLDQLATEKKDIVMESRLFVRTPCTVYIEKGEPDISFTLNKGERVEVMTYDYLQEDGSIHMYKIKRGEAAGWVYGKYFLTDERKANAFYNGNNTFLIHNGRVYEEFDLLGGKTENLDYFPVVKPDFEDNPIMKEAKAMYIDGASLYLMDDYIQIAKDSGINTIVLDIKDGYLAYQSEVARELSPSSYATAFAPESDYKQAVTRLKNAGLYVIGRIVTFNDPTYGADHPETCIDTPESSETWVSAFSRDAWTYNVKLAIEAVRKMGFNEIQFDYVRFPDFAYDMTVNPYTDFKNAYNEDKAQTIQGFLFYACDLLHEEGVYVSVDVFGDATHPYVTPQGQYWPAISNIVDAISAMPYTDHFDLGYDTWSQPYDLIYKWSTTAVQRQKETPTPAIARTWITGYDTPYWDSYVDYNADKMAEQAQALYDAGLYGGFIPWNGVASRAKYWEISEFWGRNYLTEAMKLHDTAAIDPAVYILEEDDYYVPSEHVNDPPYIPDPEATRNPFTGESDIRLPGNATQPEPENNVGGGEVAPPPTVPQDNPAPQPGNTQASYDTITVQEGDSYYDLLLSYYGDFSYELLDAFCEYNKVSKDITVTGDVLVFPPYEFFNLD